MAAERARMAGIRDRVNPEFPDEVNIVVGIDCREDAEAAERVVSQLLGYGMEGEEGVFYLLPQDLCCEVTRSGGTVTVDLLTAGDDTATEWVKVLSATIQFPEDDELPEPPIVVIDHEGVAGLDELIASIPEAGLHIVGPKPDEDEEGE